MSYNIIEAGKWYTFIGDDFDCIKQKSLMIGDASGKEWQFSDSDKKTAENFCIDYMDVEDFVNTNFGGLSYKKIHDYIK